MARLSLLALILSLLLAGCTGGDEQDDGGPEAPAPINIPPPTPPNTDPNVDPYGVRPLWFAGLRYEYEATYPAANVQGNIAVTVIGPENNLQLTIDGDEEAITWGLFYHLPPVGTYQPGTFAPILHGVPVAWFDFPLSDGKTWSAPDHRGTPVNYSAARIEIKIPEGRTVPGYDVVGERNGITWVHYRYTAEVGWFTMIEVDGNGNGAIDARLDLKKAIVYADHARLLTFLSHDGTAFFNQGLQSNANPASSFTIPGDATDLYVYFAMSGGPGVYTATAEFPTPNGTVTKQYNWTTTEQDGAQLFGERHEVSAGSGEARVIMLADGRVFAEMVPVTRQLLSG